MAPVDDGEGVGQHLQAFLDEWHFRMVHTQMVKSWDRPKALGMALDMLECSGLKYPTATFKEELLSLKDEEESMVSKLVEIMPKAMQDSFDEIALALQNALNTAATLHQAVVSGQEQAVHDSLEANTESPVACEYILRKATLQAAMKAGKVRRCHTTWRQNMEERIERLSRTQEDAEHANSQLLAVQAQLDMYGDEQKGKAKGMLVGMCDKNNKALMHATFINWLGVMMKSKGDNVIRAKFQAQLEEAEKKLFACRERQLANVKGVLGRKIAEEGDNLRVMCFSGWKKALADAKADGDTTEQIKAAKARLDAMKEGQTASAKKVLMNMSSGSNTGLMTMVWQGWQQFIEEYRKNKEMEDAVKEAEKKFQEMMAAKKDETMKVMERMSASSDSGLLQLVVKSWSECVEEERKEREAADKLQEQEKKFKSLKARQGESAKGVQGRINEMMNMTLLQKIFNNWMIDAKVNNVDKHFARKMESKRRQLKGVQDLFKTFAMQLEQGLGDGDISSRQNTGRDSTHKSYRKSRRDDSKGMVGSVSLPDIHGSKAYPA